MMKYMSLIGLVLFAGGCAEVTIAKGSKVGLENDAKVGLTGVTSVTVDPSDPGIVYIVDNGAVRRCAKGAGGKEFTNCTNVDIK